VSALSSQKKWLLWKVYGVDYFEVAFETTARVHNVLSFLIKNIDEMNDDLDDCIFEDYKQCFTSRWLKKYSDIEEEEKPERLNQPHNAASPASTTGAKRKLNT
jgi:hypothetical protein